MTILVTAATKHGSTWEIAEVIGDELRAHGLDVETTPVERVRAVAPYDAVVLGSAIYLGQWRKSAKQLAARESSSLRAMPVWLFSSGPVLTPGKAEDPHDRRQGDEVAASVGARDHRLFHGRIRTEGLSLTERAIVRAAKVPVEDQRDWDEVRAWAGGIAQALQSVLTS